MKGGERRHMEASSGSEQIDILNTKVWGKGTQRDFDEINEVFFASLSINSSLCSQ